LVYIFYDKSEKAAVQ